MKPLAHPHTCPKHTHYPSIPIYTHLYPSIPIYHLQKLLGKKRTEWCIVSICFMECMKYFALYYHRFTSLPYSTGLYETRSEDHRSLGVGGWMMLEALDVGRCWKCYSSHLQSTVTYRAAELLPYRLSSKAKLLPYGLSKSPRVIVCRSHIPRYSKWTTGALLMHC